MELEVGNILIEDVRFGPETKLDGRCLIVNPKALSEFLCQRDARLRKVEVYLARPGESTRILCVKDVIEPRSKIADDLTGEGRIHVLKQVAVVTCGKIVGFQGFGNCGAQKYGSPSARGSSQEGRACCCSFYS
jgi:glycine reductase